MQLIRFGDIPSVPVDRSDFVGTQLARRLFSTDVSGTPHLVADLGVLPPRFEHKMHRHPHCDQIVMVRRGHVVIYDEDTEITLGPDEAVVLPRNEFHALRALDEEAEILNLFPGVGDTTEAGYEVHPTTAA